jgi:branched-chain amino acid transport system substrate-binding protein
MRFYRILCVFLVTILLVPVGASLAQDIQPLVGSWDQCAAPTALPDTVTVGAVLGLTKAVAVYGTAQKNAIDLAVEEINASHYLGDKTTFAVTVEDSAGDKDQAVAAMTKLIDEDKVVAVLGPTLSSEALAADPIAQEAGTVVLGVSNTANGLTTAQGMGDYVFRDSLPESAVIPGTIKQATESLGLKKVAVLYGNDDAFTKSGYDIFKQSLTDNKVEIADEETFAKGDVDFNAQLTNAIGTEPDALVVSALAAEATQIIIQARALGYTGHIIGGNGFNSPAVLKNSGKDAEGLIVGGAWNYGNPNPSESSLAFVKNYEAKYSSSPDQFAAQAYTGAWLLATALRCGNSVDHKAVRDALAAIKDFNSPLGVFSFDENRDPVHEPIAQLVADGKFTPLASSMSAEATPEATPGS